MRTRIGSLVVVVFVLATFVWGIAAQSDRGTNCISCVLRRFRGDGVQSQKNF